ncbi:MAG: hypothetical protein HYR94_09425 [Chloroflexi bacterium]|nr:hypothetical protein [Chloroflexota bacterium]
MLPGVRDSVIGQERYKDLLREAECDRLIQIASNPQPNRWQRSSRVLHRIGLAIVRIAAKMVKWGLKLQGRSLTLRERSERSCG